MDGSELFAVIFIFTAMFGLYIATFFELGGHKILVDKLVKIVDSHINKKQEKDI